MNTVSKLFTAAAMAAALALPSASPALAGEASDDIVVSSKAAMKQWQAETTQDLNRALARTAYRRNIEPNDAIVEVAFELGADGSPENIRVLNGDGNSSAKYAAKYAVRSLSGLDDVPVYNRSNARFLAQIIFAGDQETHDELAEQLAEKRAARFASSDGEGDYILLGG